MTTMMMMHRLLPTGGRTRTGADSVSSDVRRRHLRRLNRVLIVSLDTVSNLPSPFSFANVIDVANRPSSGTAVPPLPQDDDVDQVFGEWGQLRMSG